MNLYYRLCGMRYRKPLRTSIIIVMLLISAFVVTVSVINVQQGIAEIPPSAETYISVEPENTTASLGAWFVVDIDLNNNPGSTHAWELNVTWDNTVLNIEDILSSPDIFSADVTPLVYAPPTLGAAQAVGYVIIGQSKLGANYTNADGTLCSLNFTVSAVDSCVIMLSDTRLEDLGGVLTEYPNRDGSFNEPNAAVLDVRVVSVSADDYNPAPGDTVTVTVVTKNEGGAAATSFDVDVYADIEIYDSVDKDDVKVGDEILIGSYSVGPLGAGDQDSTGVAWTDALIAADSYYLSAEVSNLSPGPDDDPHDDILINGIVVIDVLHDIKVTSLTATATVFRREDVEIAVGLKNQGTTTPELFDLVVYGNYSLANQELIANITGLSLNAGQSTTQTIQWDTTYVANGMYIINATVIPANAERTVDELDNTLTTTTTVFPLHDIKVSAIIVNPTDVWITETVVLSVILVNKGTETETFNLYWYADQLEINVNSSISLAGSADPYTPPSVYVIFNWDTTGQLKTGYGYPKDLYYPPTDGAYLITCFVPSLDGERPEDTEDNRFQAGQAVVIKVITGDVNGSGAVDGLDKIIAGITLFESKP